MIRRLTILCALVAVLCLPGLAQEHEHAAAAKGKAVTLMAGVGNWRHPVSTKNAQAQAFFDQGLRLIYAFNHDEAWQKRWGRTITIRRATRGFCRRTRRLRRR